MVSSNRGCGLFQEFGCVLGCIFPLDESCSHAEEASYRWVHVLIYSCGSDFVKTSFRNMFTLYPIAFLVIYLSIECMRQMHYQTC